LYIFSSCYYCICSRLIILSLSLYLALFSVCLIRFSFRQQNHDNGFEYLHIKLYKSNIPIHQIVPLFVRDYCFFFFKLFRITNISLFIHFHLMNFVWFNSNKILTCHSLSHLFYYTIYNNVLIIS